MRMMIYTHTVHTYTEEHLFLSTHTKPPPNTTHAWIPLRICTHSIYTPTHTHTEPGVDVWTWTSEWKADHSCTAAMNTVDQSVPK